MKDSKRLIGVDLFRGIAAYAVVLFHSGDQTWAPMERGAIELRDCFTFAVPFFLALSFYLATRKFYTSNSSYSFQSKVKRILVPYLLWTAVYVVFKLSSYAALGQSDKLNEFLQDPVAVLFMGAASLQLYFLPLLFIGSLLLPIAKYLSRRANLISLLLLFMLSLVAYEIMMYSGNGFQLGSNVAFQPLAESIMPNSSEIPLLRVFLVFLAWSIRCLPYIFLAMIVNYLFTKKNLQAYTQQWLIFLSIFVVFRLASESFTYLSSSEVLVAFSLLLLAISLSNSLSGNKWISNLGACSFGIYLVHPFPIQIIEMLVQKFFPGFIAQISIASLLVFSISSFLISWAATAVLIKRKWFAKYMLGA